MKTAVIALGGNVGNPLEAFRGALARMAGVGVVAGVSGVYKTPPRFYEAQADFLNAAAALSTGLGAAELLDFCKKTEAEFGRRPSFRNAPRPLDLDIVFLDGDRVDLPNLRIPHADWQNRDFVKTPLLDLLELGIFSKPCFDFVRARLSGAARAYKKIADL